MGTLLFWVITQGVVVYLPFHPPLTDQQPSMNSNYRSLAFDMRGRGTASVSFDVRVPFKDEAQTTSFKDPDRTAL
jgi:hypothetical protein